ncbi:CocE/NonD family hydrolase [Aureimonas sp. AU4]|uniref:CocE/NonD family hydrolase n=1 Tax=Aureimonas sp. AU4 TaxID=1638163 RepID=UPI0007836FB2|nr:CocE/NonD family hydrolase [Aureimonas sp. AU4]
MTVEITEHLWVPLRDGTRLGARLWLPAGASEAPVPAILEYIPYRKHDGTRGRDEPMHGFFAENGYAALRVDMRGTGESDGLMDDEYLLQEQEDALDVIAWIAAQGWCTGSVGMMGKSWGGFNALQVAARRPPALKAIISAYSTDDRFRDDIHFMGGCLLNDNLWWGAIMLAYQSRPLDPAIVGETWRERWIERLEHLPLFPALWMRHQRYDDYWKHGSVQEDWSAIECPVLAVGGWADSYTNAVPRLLANLQVPRLGIIGPWGHIYPQDGVPGPAIGFLQEAVRWWDHWLKGEDRGIMREPMLRAWLSDSYAPAGTRTQTPGRWVGEPAIPSPGIAMRPLGLGADGSLRLDEAAGGGERSIRSPQSHGRAGGEWMGTGCVGEMPVDQRLDDGGALVFETPVLAEPLPVLGAPVLHVRLRSDAPQAQIAVRLSEVLPDGAVTRVSYQVLNLSHRDGHESPEALVPGEWVDVRVTLGDCGHRFAAGSRVRLAVATSYWPLVWPAPHAATLTLDTGASRLELPMRRRNDDASPVFPPPARGPATPVTQLDPGSVRRWSTQDHVTGETTYVTEGVGGLFGEGVLRFDETGTELSHSLRRELRIRDDDPLSARYVLEQSYEMGREGWRTRTQTRCVLTGDRERFHLTVEHAAFEGDKPVWSRRWNETIERDNL